MRPTLPIHSQGLWRTAAVPEFGCSDRSPVGARSPHDGNLPRCRAFDADTAHSRPGRRPERSWGIWQAGLPSPGAGARRRAGDGGILQPTEGPSPPEPIGRGGLTDSAAWAKDGTTSPRKRRKVSRGSADPARSTTCGGVPAIIPRPEIAVHIVEELGVGQESKLIAALTARSSARG
jgi:hypothetical protein